MCPWLHSLHCRKPTAKAPCQNEPSGYKAHQNPTMPDPQLLSTSAESFVHERLFSSASMAFLSCLFSFIFLLFLMFSFSEATEILVGGRENLWKIPSSPDEFNHWAEKIRFRIGDSLVLKYDGKTDSVLQVTEEDYKSCKTAKPIKTYHDGDTKIELSHSGPFFFISGAEGHCERGQKLVVEVLSSKHSQSNSPALAMAPAPSPASDGHGLRVGVVGFVLAFGSMVELAFA
ncbi:unnamed protein product [Ilex paraguariensis]|uniref:Phytocyanin domain-containing protein n=1 Tax=Ilex paraguariensis TaxID=185542 RepID=A0ABC8UQH9_9AQUA